VVAGLVLFAALLSAAKIAGQVHGAIEMSGDDAMAVRLAAFGVSAVAVVLVSIIVAFFYCLSALNGERRDRSILFWKSLPVSDLKAVLAKASIPMIVLPAFVFVVVVVMQIVLLMLGAFGMLLHGGGPGLLGADFHLPQLWTLLFYGLAVVTLWYAPLYGWTLMVSAWAKRAPFLWAVLPPLALALVERLGLGTDVTGRLLHDRFNGFAVGFKDGLPHGNRWTVTDPMQMMDPAALLASPGLWGGLIAAAGFLAATVWLRRSRDPV
jgi:ABC-2 type transport system permease protein